MIKSLLIVGIGGMAGSMLRYGASLVVKNHHFPYATLAVNLVGSFILGCIAGYTFKHTGFESNWKLFLTTGFCGGFTTFSSFSFESLQLLQQNRYFTASLYIAVSTVIGIACAMAGWSLTK